MAGIQNSPLWNFSPKSYEENPTWRGDVASNLSLIYKPLANKLENFYFKPDPNFNITPDMLNVYPTNVYSDLYQARSQEEFDNIGYMYNEMSKIREKLSINNSITAMLMAGILDPINLIPIPGAVGMGFIRGAKRAIPSIAGLSAGQEAWRAHRDPTHTTEEAVYAITGSAFFGGLLSGTIGHLTRGINVGKVGDLYNRAQMYDENNPESTITTKKVKRTGVNSKDKLDLPTEEPNIKSPIELGKLLDAERTKNVTNLQEGILGKLDKSQRTAPVFLNFQELEKVSPLGRGTNRFDSPESAVLIRKLIGDYTSVSRAVKEGEVNMKEGSVITNDSQWLYANQTIIRTINDEFTKYAGDLTGEPSKIVNIPISKIGVQLKNRFSKSDKLREHDFAREVTVAIVNASDNTRVIEGSDVPAGMVTHRIPEVEKAAKIVIKKMEEAEKAGTEVGVWKTEDGIKKEYLQDLSEYSEYYMPYKRLRELKTHTEHDKFMLNLQERYLLGLINDMEDKEYFIIKQLRKQNEASHEMEAIIDSVLARKEELSKKYDVIITDEILKKTQAVKKISDLELHIRDSLESQKEILTQLNNDYHTRGLSPKQLEYRNVLIKRFYDLYGLHDADIGLQPIPATGGTIPQQDYLSQLLKEVNAPRSPDKANYMKDLLEKIRVPATEKQVKYLTNLQKTITETHLTKESIMPPNEAHYLMRMWDEGSIRDNYELFVEKVLIPHVMKKPRGSLRKKLEEQPEPNATRSEVMTLEDEKLEAVTQKAKQIANKIINDIAEGNFDNVNGKGQARFFMKRDLDMPNYQLLKEYNGIADFIETDVKSISNAYFHKFGPSIEMARLFKGDRLGERAIRKTMYQVAIRYADEINAKGGKAFAKRLFIHEDDFKISRDVALQRIGNANSGSLSNQAIRTGMQIAQISMLGKATLASLADVGKIVLSRGMKDTFGRYLSVWGTDINEKMLYQMAARDIEVTGESLGGISNANKSRVVMSETVGSQNSRKLGKFGDMVMGKIDDMSNSFYNANLLNPWTDKLKQWVGVIAADRILRSAAHVSSNLFYIKMPPTKFKIRYGKGKTVGDRYIPAYSNRNDKMIYFDKDGVDEMYKSKAWLNPKVKGVKPLEDIFETPDEFSDFVLLHEITHSRHPNKKNKPIADYENDTNAIAMKEFKKQKTAFTVRTINEKGNPVQTMSKREMDDLNFDLSILRQYGLSQRDLINIHENWKKADGPKKYRGKEIYYSNVQEWGENIDPEVTAKYIRAIRADQINTIVTPTAGDKPLAAYGMLGRGEQRRQHNMFKMPLQFFSWSFGANNKIIMSSLQGRHKGQMSGMVAMLALGFMSDFIRNPSYWKQKPLEEKIIKGIEYSGLSAYWLDINNSIEIMTDNSFGIRPSVGEGNMFVDDLGDIIGEPFGPLGSIMSDVVKMLSDPNLSDNRRASILRRLIPYNNLFYADWLFKGAQKSIMGTN